ncbi:hypothetical protein NP233_g8492 [Leucocoprinus birnbaumii]|uniref:L-tryptophan decarboxylase PsiD-like domain-containing protein n=1 Tax=Leucocoprinus birnbaumii TaxID=56174 RepID=A0AAD5VPQ5_9AGAR|nr:hypothetical protein NP233_g8492 [Leucocoprinus birnbaumii]
MSESAVYPVGRYNGWLPRSRAVHEAFFRDLAARAESPTREGKPHTPAVEKFKKAIEADEIMVELWRQIFRQVSKDPKIPDPLKIHDFNSLLHHMDLIVVAPPKFTVTKEASEPIGVPLYLLLDLLSNTSAAYDLFRYPRFNDAMKDLLDSWGQYLRSSDSNWTLTNEPDGWFSEASLEILEKGRGPFNQTYITPDPTAINRGYASWDKFFTRELQPGARPIYPAPPGSPTPIYNACESAYERIQRNVQTHDKFWLKGMKYSLYDIFDHDEHHAKQFLGGTIYQAFLSPQDYHHWHSPVKGTVVDARLVPGTYYAVLPDDGEPLAEGSELQQGDPHGAMIRSQPWLTVSAARALIFIKADQDEIGLVCVVAVGMVEVSTCELSVRRDDRVEPGQQLGLFHFGGSSHAVIFGPQANITFTDEVKPGNHIQINRIIAFVSK